MLSSQCDGEDCVLLISFNHLPHVCLIVFCVISVVVCMSGSVEVSSHKYCIGSNGLLKIMAVLHFY
jgi:hypothetical protein